MDGGGEEGVHAVLIALQGDALLMPNAAVSEVVSRVTLRPEPAGPDWLVGYLSWQSRRVPVVSFELLNGQPGGAPGRRSRVAVIHALGSRLQGGAYGLLCEGYPHLVTLSRRAVVPARLRPEDREPFIATRVRLARQEAVIPAVERLETEIATALAELTR